MTEKLTPERLAEIEDAANEAAANTESMGFCDRECCPPPDYVPELLAEVKRLREELVLETARKGIYRHERDEARRARVALAAQVASLREALAMTLREYKGAYVTHPEYKGPTAEFVLADTAAVAETHDRHVVEQWLIENVPERYQYASGPDGTPESAFADLCKDALKAMPGPQRQKRLEGARELTRRLNGNGGSSQVLADMEREASNG